MNAIEWIQREMDRDMEDWDKESEKLRGFYDDLDDKEREAVDLALTYICGWTLKTAFEKSEESSESSIRPCSYETLLDETTQYIREERLRAARATNMTMHMIYWTIGRRIAEERWEARDISRLSADLRMAFPDMDVTLTPRNLWRMRALAIAWPDPSIVRDAFLKLPWPYNIVLLEKLSDRDERLWYAEQAFTHGWGLETLKAQIELNAYAKRSNGHAE